MGRPARSVALGGLAALVTLAGLAAAPSVVSARVRASAVVDSGGQVRRISISDRGIVVERGGSRDTTLEWSGDVSERAVRERIRHGIRTGIRTGVVEIDDGGSGIVRIWSDAFVPAGKLVEGDVVAVFGSVHLKSGAKVEGDVVSIGGGLDQAEGVTINGESVQLGFSPFTWGLPGLSVLLFAVAAGWLVSMFMGWIFALLFPASMLRVATVVERRPAASFFLGILSVPMFFVALVLLCITVIGIPLGILLPMVYVLMGYAGQLAATCVLGARLTRRSLSKGLMTPLLVGTLFVAILLAAGIGLMGCDDGLARPASLFLSLSGGLLLLGLGTLGTGAFLLSRFGNRPRDVVWQGHSATSSDPIPPPPTS